MNFVKRKTPFKLLAGVANIRALFLFLGFLIFSQNTERQGRWRTIQRISGSFLNASAARYPSLMRRADPDLDLYRLKEATFVGHGSGTWNLHAYRKGVISGLEVFEKIYLVDSDGIRKMLWAYSSVAKHFAPSFKAPSLICRLKGNWLVACYFQFLPEVRPIDREQLVSAAIRFQECVDDFRWDGRSEAIYDFRRDAMYAQGFTALGQIVRSHGYSESQLQAIESWLLGPDVPCRFAHGDFTTKNVLRDGFVIDFDRSGYYPIGYDLGCLTGRFHDFDRLEKVKEFILMRFEPPGWKAYVSILFFASIFAAKKKLRRNVSDYYLASLVAEVLQQLRKNGVFL